MTLVPVSDLIPCFLNDFSSSDDTASSSTGTSRVNTSMIVTSLPNLRKMEANSTPTAPLPRITSERGSSCRWIASSLVMMRVRSMSTPGTLRGVEPVATMISLASSVCFSPSKTSTLPLPASRAVPLIQSILFFLKRNSMPRVRPLTTLSLRVWTWVMSIAGVPAGIVTPHSLAFWMTFSACACSSSAFVGMQPQMRQVPPSAFCFSTTATFIPSCAARIAAT